MRTDVKVGLICVFGIILAVVIYYVAQGNIRSPRKAEASDASATPATAPAGSPGDLQVAPGASADNRGLSIASDSAAGRTLAQVPTGGPGSAIRGSVIAPPSSPSTPVSAGAATMPASGSGASADGGNPTGSATGSIIPAPGTMPASGISGSGTGGAPLPEHTIDVPSPGAYEGPRSGLSKFNESNGGGGMTGSAALDEGSHLAGAGISSAGSATYTIAKGDMLGAIAKSKGVTLKALQAANPGVDSTKLKIGQVIKIPETGASAPTSTAIIPASTRPARTSARAAAHATAATAHPVGAAKPGSTYTVKKGDTLGKIAISVYGNKNAWQRIFRANRGEISDANVIPVGTVLKLPS